MLLIRTSSRSIQPPGAIQLTYAVEPSFVYSGRFYMLDAMHLTEVCRACAALSASKARRSGKAKATSKAGPPPGSVRLLSRIALFLAYSNQESGKSSTPSCITRSTRA